ncbi:MAG TPA: ATP-dependent zinc metalloprotease FtsH [Candidatus Latescibacteria bacterium]|jgi:cell division protease FtsH|nr:ATP-dependent zinc metalloprotease FtsH [Candidatus Latescibacterota bacterium]HJP33136.1 ATP-dependent zinc metalloprotease FtsH [Candidatus Latescibacterota bacterium]
MDEQPRQRQDGSGDDRPRMPWRWPSRSRAFWIFLILVLIIAAKFYGSTPSDTREVSFVSYQEYLDSGRIAGAKIIGDQEFHGILRDGTRFVVNLGPIDAETKRAWLDAGIEDFSFEDKPFQWYSVLISFLPWLLFIGFWIFMLRQMQGGPRGLFSFGKSRAKVLTEDRRKTTFQDVAGVDEAKEELNEIIEFLKDPKKFQRLGGRTPKGVLLVGPPGTGKTHLARAVAGEAGVPFFSISGSDFVEMFVGVGASRVRDLFEQGKTNAPCIIFIDEIDAVGRHRGAGIGGGHDEREQTLNQLLVEMDGFESNDGVILIAATNRPDVLDPALLRPGRFDRRVVVNLPDVRGRRGILEVHSRNVPLGEDVDLERLAKGTPGLSGADLENLVNEAALLASRRDREHVAHTDFEEAKDKVMLGAERKSVIMTEEDKRLAAVHEAGHALAAKMTPGAPPINKAVIVPRGQTMGMVSFLAEERHSITESRLKAHLVTGLGGCCAESIVFGERSTGAQADYKQVTGLARSMVCDWGMNKDLGPLALGGDEEEVFLGKDFGRTRMYSEQTAQAVDGEIRDLVIEAEGRARDLLEARRKQLDDLTDALLEFEVLDDGEIDRVLEGLPIEREPDSPVSVAADRADTEQLASSPEPPAQDAAEG